MSPTTSAPAAISTPTLTFTAGRFSALSYKPTTGINTVYIPTNTSHLTNDSGFLTGNLADFAKGNAGSSTQGVYVTSGTVKAMTYSLKATVNSGSSGKLAYYSGTNSIDDYTSTKGSSSTPI